MKFEYFVTQFFVFMDQKKPNYENKQKEKENRIEACDVFLPRWQHVFHLFLHKRTKIWSNIMRTTLIYSV